jgi:TFIIF-interacting CTD phosphatase-like protein
MTDKTDDKPLYKPFKSSAKNKKFSVFVMKNGKKKLIHFGDTRYDDFTTHKDEKRRQNYLKRTAGIRDKDGNLTKDDKNSANYWARLRLWSA